MGSGPFIFEQHQTGQFIQFRANPNYWGGAPHIKELVFRIFQSEDTMVAGAQEGRDRLRRHHPADVLQLAEGPDRTSPSSTPSTPASTRSRMNTGAALVPGQADRQRQPGAQGRTAPPAPSTTAIDRKTLVDKVLGGYGDRRRLVHPADLCQTSTTRRRDDARPFNLDTANQMLDAAGYTKGADGIRINPADTASRCPCG